MEKFTSLVYFTLLQLNLLFGHSLCCDYSFLKNDEKAEPGIDIFLIDTSSSNSPDEFNNAKTFIEELIKKRFLLRQDMNRIAVITFAAKARIALDNISDNKDVVPECELFRPGGIWQNITYLDEVMKAYSLENATDYAEQIIKNSTIAPNIEHKRIWFMTDAHDINEFPVYHELTEKFQDFVFYGVGLNICSRDESIQMLRYKFCNLTTDVNSACDCDHYFKHVNQQNDQCPGKTWLETIHSENETDILEEKEHPENSTYVAVVNNLLEGHSCKCKEFRPADTFICIPDSSTCSNCNSTTLHITIGILAGLILVMLVVFIVFMVIFIQKRRKTNRGIKRPCPSAFDLGNTNTPNVDSSNTMSTVVGDTLNNQHIPPHEVNLEEKAKQEGINRQSSVNYEIDFSRQPILPSPALANGIEENGYLLPVLWTGNPYENEDIISQISQNKHKEEALKKGEKGNKKKTPQDKINPAHNHTNIGYSLERTVNGPNNNQSSNENKKKDSADYISQAYLHIIPNSDELIENTNNQNKYSYPYLHRVSPGADNYINSLNSNKPSKIMLVTQQSEHYENVNISNDKTGSDRYKRTYTADQKEQDERSNQSGDIKVLATVRIGSKKVKHIASLFGNVAEPTEDLKKITQSFNNLL